MTGTIAPLPPSDVRSDKRTNIFLGATLRFDGRTAPVRVRDLSPNGAQIEGVALPAQEARVTLERGSVFAEGVVAWRATDRCGLRFSTPLPVAAWWPGREAPRTQADVDWTVAEIRAEIAARAAAPSDQNVGPKNGNLEPIVSPPADLATILPARVAEELACVVRMLRGIEDELSLEAWSPRAIRPSSSSSANRRTSLPSSPPCFRPPIRRNRYTSFPTPISADD